MIFLTHCRPSLCSRSSRSIRLPTSINRWCTRSLSLSKDIITVHLCKNRPLISSSSKYRLYWQTHPITLRPRRIYDRYQFSFPTKLIILPFLVGTLASVDITLIFIFDTNHISGLWSHRLSLSLCAFQNFTEFSKGISKIEIAIGCVLRRMMMTCHNDCGTWSRFRW